MATESGGLDIDLHRHLALECMPPSELRDDYLCYLDGLERKARLAAELPERPDELPPAAGAGNEAHRWTVQRYVVAAIGSVVLAAGTWLVTSLL
jgi:hypothetical protein